MQNNTNFEKVTEFNEVLGQGVAATPCIPSFDQVQLRMSLIQEEAISELSKGFGNRDLIEIADAIGDGLVVLYGAANDCGLDADAIMNVIHLSNMSKLCDNEEDAKFAVEQYGLGNGFHGKNSPIKATYRPSKIEGKFVVVNAETGKTLKGPSFFEPQKMLAEIIFPNGEPVQSHIEEREKVRKLVSEQKLNMAQAWMFEEVLDAVEAK